MDREYIFISLIRLGLLLFSFLALPQGLLMMKSAWLENDSKKIKKGVSLIWGAIISACIFLKMLRGFV